MKIIDLELMCHKGIPALLLSLSFAKIGFKTICGFDERFKHLIIDL
jgi:hypothetical protein